MRPVAKDRGNMGDDDDDQGLKHNAAGQLQACGNSRVRGIRDNVRVSVRDRVGVRFSYGVRVSTFYFLSY